MYSRAKLPAILAFALALSLGPCLADLDADAWLDEPLNSPNAVNRGGLVFLTEAPQKPVHHHRNRIVIGDSTLSDGWADLGQCHQHMDAVPRAQVVYNPANTEGLVVESHTQIGEAWVEGASVQLRDVQAGATLCVSARSRVMEADGEGGYIVRNGPFMRRFLDGFYPMRVSVDIEIPGRQLRFVDITPHHQGGFEVRHDEKGVHFDALFEGRLFTEVRFKAVR